LDLSRGQGSRLLVALLLVLARRLRLVDDHFEFANLHGHEDASLLITGLLGAFFTRISLIERIARIWTRVGSFLGHFLPLISLITLICTIVRPKNPNAFLV
jgi:hypothetical protein